MHIAANSYAECAKCGHVHWTIDLWGYLSWNLLAARLIRLLPFSGFQWKLIDSTPTPTYPQ